MSEAIKGEILCTAGRATPKCIHKKNATLYQGQVKIQICEISATKEQCSAAGSEVE